MEPCAHACPPLAEHLVAHLVDHLPVAVRAGRNQRRLPRVVRLLRRRAKVEQVPHGLVVAGLGSHQERRAAVDHRGAGVGARLQNAGDDRVVPALGRDQQWGAPVRRGGVDRRPLVEQERHRNGRAVQARHGKAVQARHVERRVAVAARPAGLRRRVAFPVAFPPMLPADGGCPRRVLEQAGDHLEVSARGEAASVRAVLPSRRSAALRSMRSTPCSRSLATVRSYPAFFQRQV